MSLEHALLLALQPWRTAPGLCVALSGGLDSSVLLHALVSLSRTQPLPPIRAIHIHHGLQPAADAWAEHCRQLCVRLDVPLQVVRVQVAPGASLERAAREARYAAFAERLGPGELLLSAQHRDDQAETLLFRLLRGSGLRGLGGMPQVRVLGAGVLLRPLLQHSRAELQAYAEAQQLGWVEDPSNQDLRFARNYLRQRVMPLLWQRWPQGSAVLARAAQHLSEAQQLLDERARDDLATAGSPGDFAWLPCPSLALAPLVALSGVRQRNALRYWLAGLGESMPDSAHWSGWEALRDAGVDAAPVWQLAQGRLQRAGGRIYWLTGDWCEMPPAPPRWPLPGDSLALPGNGSLRLEGAGAVPPGLQVRYRRGGEQLVVAGRGRRDLKRLLNESGLPPFVRARLPLLYAGEQLLAVANLPVLSTLSGSTARLVWLPPACAAASQGGAAFQV